MKTYAPKSLRGSDLRDLLDQLVATPAQVAKFLDVTERSVWRWLADGTAPRAVLYALWHETPHGREVSALDVGNELVITRRMARGAQDAQAVQVAQLSRVLAISDTGAANDALVSGPWAVRPSGLRLSVLLPLGLDPGLEAGKLGHEGGGDHGPGDHNEGFAAHFGQ